MKFLPKTVEEFDQFYSGEKKPRPKILIHPQTNEYYRLVSPLPNSDYGGGQYQPMEVPQSNIYFYEMDEEHLAFYKDRKLPPLPNGFHIKQLHLQKDPKKPLKLDEISIRQLYELMNAIGNDSGWWPLEDPSYDSLEYFSHLNINVLFDGHKPAAVHMWDAREFDLDHEIVGSFIGTVPEYRGQGYGGYMIKWGLQKLAREGCIRYYLNTGDDDMLPPNGIHQAGLAASDYYERLGFEFKREEKWHPNDVKSGPIGEDGIPLHLSKMTVGNDYFLKADSGIIGKFTDAAIKQRLANAFRPQYVA